MKESTLILFTELMCLFIYFSNIKLFQNKKYIEFWIISLRPEIPLHIFRKYYAVSGDWNDFGTKFMEKILIYSVWIELDNNVRVKYQRRITQYTSLEATLFSFLYSLQIWLNMEKVIFSVTIRSPSLLSAHNTYQLSDVKLSSVANCIE